MAISVIRRRSDVNLVKSLLSFRPTVIFSERPRCSAAMRLSIWFLVRFYPAACNYRASMAPRRSGPNLLILNEQNFARRPRKPREMPPADFTKLCDFQKSRRENGNFRGRNAYRINPQL